jgi:hypothetical protein
MKILINNAVLFTILFILVGCIPGNSNQKNPTSGLFKPLFNHTALEYIDSTAFDESLSNAMNQAEAKIEVSVLTPFSSNNIPERLDTWLTVIKENGGEVNTEPAENERSIIGIALALFSAYQLVKEQLRYLPAKNYHATLLYRRAESGDALIEKIVFTHK